MKQKVENIIVLVTMIVYVLLTTIVFSCVWGLRGARDNTLFEYAYATNSKVGQWSEYLGVTSRSKPIVSNGGLSRYPVYNQDFEKLETETTEDFVKLRQDVLAENGELISTTGHTLTGNYNYNEMDENGYLFLNGEPVLDKSGNHRRLYKHTASEGMYLGNVADNENAIIKRIHITPRSTGDNYITGLYAPAGEVVKIEISSEDLDAIGELSVYIGQIMYNGLANNIWIKPGSTQDQLERVFNRMPVIATKYPVKKTICYVGSYLGGPIYIGNVRNKNDFTVTISGAVPYSHFILGSTTKEEFEFNRKSSAPFFDLEVFDESVRFSGPKSYAGPFSYDELYESAVLWDKISRVSNLIPNSTSDKVGVAFLFDPFIAAGAAVAFVGNNSTNCPLDWMTNSLDYESFVTNGAWGNIHEFNHHYQRFGLNDNTEVSNNAVSLIEYSLFTKISAKRSTDPNTLGNDWPRFTDPSRALQETLALSQKGTPNTTLSSYADILHAFGQTKMIQAAQYANGRSGNSVWFEAVSETMHQDMTYYFEKILNITLDADVKARVQAKKYPTFVPVASVFQTGRSFFYDDQKVYSNTVQPYVLDSKNPVFDLKSSIVIPNGFRFNIKSVTNPEYGMLSDFGNGTYRYDFDGIHDESGNIIATLEIIKEDLSFSVQDVELVLRFKRKTTGSATTSIYTFSDLNQFATLEDAEAHLDMSEGEPSVVEVASPHTVMSSRQVRKFEGKIRISQTGKWRFVHAARYYSNLYISFDGVHFEKMSRIYSEAYRNWDLATEAGHYKDYDLVRGQWVYFRCYGIDKIWDRPNESKEERYFSIGFGQIKSDGTVSISTLSGIYSFDSEIEKFTSDYYEDRFYSIDALPQLKQSITIVDTNFVPYGDGYKLENMFDSNQGNFMHSKSRITETNFFEMTIDLGANVVANKMTMVGRDKRVNQTHTPVSFKLYVGQNAESLKLIGEWEDEPLAENEKDMVVYFDTIEFRCYKIIVTKTSSNDVICLYGLNFEYDFSGGRQLSPDDRMISYYGKWDTSHHGTFGHIYSANSGRVTFEFIGTQFLILSNYLGKDVNFEISIDGGKFQKISAKYAEWNVFASYVSQSLEYGKHNVTIKAGKNFNLDSIAIR